MSVKLTSGTTTIFLQNPVRGDTREKVLPHSTGRTASGQLYRYKKGPEYLIVSVTWEYLRDDEREDLEDFFDTTVSGPSNSFTYVDHLGFSYTAIFLNDSLKFNCMDDTKASDGFYVASGSAYPTTTRKNPVWEVSVEMQLS